MVDVEKLSERLRHAKQKVEHPQGDITVKQQAMNSLSDLLPELQAEALIAIAERLDALLKMTQGKDLRERLWGKEDG